jgi:hypothetical protein
MQDKLYKQSIITMKILIDLIPFRSLAVDFQSPSYYFHLNSKILSFWCLCYKWDILFALLLPSNTNVQAYIEECTISENI